MRISLVLVFILSSAAAFAQTAEFKFNTPRNLKLAKVPEGEVVAFEYQFTNKGDAPLIISKIEVACPCTKFEYPKTPIKPGETGTIKVTFDTDGKIGYQDRTLLIYANTKDSPTKARFRIMVDNK